MTIGHHHGGAPLPEKRFSGRVEYQQLIRDALVCAGREGWRELILCDADFEDWPLAEREVVDSLAAWSRHGRQITLIARRWDHVIRHYARFVTWRRTWADIIEARGSRGADPAEFPSAIWTPAWMMQRHDLIRWNGIATFDAARRLNLRQDLDEWVRQSASAFPASTLGL